MHYVTRIRSLKVSLCKIVVCAFLFLFFELEKKRNKVSKNEQPNFFADCFTMQTKKQIQEKVVYFLVVLYKKKRRNLLLLLLLRKTSCHWWNELENTKKTKKKRILFIRQQNFKIKQITWFEIFFNINLKKKKKKKFLPPLT